MLSVHPSRQRWIRYAIYGRNTWPDRCGLRGLGGRVRRRYAYTVGRLIPSCCGNRGDRGPLGAEGVDGLVGRDPGGVPLLLRCLLPLLPGLGALVSPAIHRRGGHRAGHLRERLRRARRGGLQGGPLVMQEGLDGFPQVFDQMKPIHDLDGLRGATANAVRIEGTPIPTDHGHRRMLGEPVRHACPPSARAGGPAPDDPPD